MPDFLQNSDGWHPNASRLGYHLVGQCCNYFVDILLPLTDLTVTFFPEYHMSIGFQLAREVPKLIVSNDPSILRYKSVTTFHSRPSLYHSFSLCLNKRMHSKEKRAVVAQHFARQMLPHMNVISYNYLLYISVLRFGYAFPNTPYTLKQKLPFFSRSQQKTRNRIIEVYRNVACPFFTTCNHPKKHNFKRFACLAE